MAKKKRKIRYAFMDSEYGRFYSMADGDVRFYKSIAEAEAEGERAAEELHVEGGDTFVLVSVETLSRYEVRHVVEVVALPD